MGVHLGDVAHCARDVDFAIRWGFGWQRGPFELWKAAGEPHGIMEVFWYQAEKELLQRQDDEHGDETGERLSA